MTVGETKHVEPFNPVLKQPPRSRLDRPTLRTTFQFLGTIRPKGEGHSDVFPEAVDLVLKWFKSRSDVPFPNEAWVGQSFRTSPSDENVECVAIPDEGIWSLLWTAPDKPFYDRAAVPGRTWLNGIALRAGDQGEVHVGFRAQCSSRAHATDEIVLTRPKVIVNLANEFELSEARPITKQAWIIDDESDLDTLDLRPA